MCSESVSEQTVQTGQQNGEAMMRKFDMLMSDAMRVTIDSVFGEPTSELIYQLSEKQASLGREKIGGNLEAFQSYLQKLVGVEISQILVANSLKKLYIALQREYAEIEKHLSLLDELYDLKFRLLTPMYNENTVSPLHN